MRESVLRGCALLLLAVAVVWTAPAVAQETGEQTQEEQELAQQNVEEIVIVTASRTEQLLLEAPVAMSVIDSADIALSPALNYADLLRGVPGLNVTQTSARDMNMSSRSSTGTLDASQLVLIDGRSVYQDFFGFVAWDLLPLDFNDIQQIEVIRGPGSAVWGANAMSGVVNIITKTPRSVGNAFRMRAGVGERGTGLGALTYNGASENVAYRFSASYYTQEAWDRPGALPNGIARDTFPNQGTRQPKGDARIDFTLTDASYLSLMGGGSGTSGTIHTGIGPFSIKPGTSFWYGRGDYNLNDLNVRFYTNILDGEAVNLLNGLLFLFKANTYDVSATNTTRFGRHEATYGADYRWIDFDLSIAPGETARNEYGGFAQFNFNLGNYFSIDAGIRADKFNTIEDVVVSPRGALLITPGGTPNHVVRLGFGRAFRAPSLINNFLDVTIFNAVVLPFAGFYVFPSQAVGNPDLTEERLDQVEIGYRGAVDNGKYSWDLSFYRTVNTDSIDFYTSAVYTAFSPPPGWPLPPFLLPPTGPVLLPAQFSYRNIGEIVNRGIEVGLRMQAVDRNTLVVNYSWQDTPEVTGIPANEIGVPPEHLFNIGWNGYSGNVYYGAAVNYVGEAYWTDVLDSRFYGFTEAYTTVDTSLGYMFLDGTLETSLRATNLFDVDAIQHIYGDIIGRRVVFEVALNVR